MRKVPFVNDEYYHVYNRGVEKRDVFCDQSDYERFLTSMILMNDVDAGLSSKWRDYHASNPSASLNDFLYSPRPDLGSVPRSGLGIDRIVDIVAYCLNPNHFHLLLKQKEDKGIERFMQRLGTGYTRYFNDRHERSGVLFQGKFKASLVDSDEYLLHVIAYVDANSEVHGIESAEAYPWCSYSEWGATTEAGATGKARVISGRTQILSRFHDRDDYHTFARLAVEGMRRRKENERSLLPE